MNYYEKYTNQEFLDMISYTSNFSQSLKQISLSKTPLNEIINDINSYRKQFSNRFSLNESLIGVRFKSSDSVNMKIERIKK